MTTVRVDPVKRFHAHPGNLKIPGDKSISHRGVMFGALATGDTQVRDYLASEDVHSTIRCFETMGVQVEKKGADLFVHGKGADKFVIKSATMDCGNSGTTMRLMMGILAGCGLPSSVTLVGDESLSRRPMSRVAGPLAQMGGRITLRDNKFAPLKIESARLHAIEYSLPVASAQVKSALMLAGLFASGTTRLTGLIESRDHTERLLPHFGAKVKTSIEAIEVTGGQTLHSATVQVPSDLSSAAFWMAAAALVPNGKIEIEGLSLNPTRTGFINVIRRMGANIRTEVAINQPEPMGSLVLTQQDLLATTVSSREVPYLVDEIPMVAVLATQAHGETVVRGAEELRVKESDRIEALAQNLRLMGAKLDVFEDGFAIEGPQKLHGAKLPSYSDHRIAMAFTIAGLFAEGQTEILNAECVDISYPSFYQSLEEVLRG